jgi:hypothetical protein
MTKSATVHQLPAAASMARSPERERLAEKQAAYRDLQAQIEMLGRVDSQSLGIWDLEAEIEEKKKSIQTAEQGEVDAMLERASGKPSPARQSIAEAHAALQEVDAKLTRVREARELSRKRVTELRGDQLRWAGEDVEHAFRDVVASEPSMLRLWDEFLKARERYFLLRFMFDGGSNLHGLAAPWLHVGTEESSSRDVVMNYYRPAGADLLHAALQRLLSNSDEPLPTFDEMVNAEPPARPAA